MSHLWFVPAESPHASQWALHHRQLRRNYCINIRVHAVQIYSWCENKGTGKHFKTKSGHWEPVNSLFSLLNLKKGILASRCGGLRVLQLRFSHWKMFQQLRSTFHSSLRSQCLNIRTLQTRCANANYANTWSHPDNYEYLKPLLQINNKRLQQ